MSSSAPQVYYQTSPRGSPRSSPRNSQTQLATNSPPKKHSDPDISAAIFHHEAVRVPPPCNPMLKRRMFKSRCKSFSLDNPEDKEQVQTAVNTSHRIVRAAVTQRIRHVADSYRVPHPHHQSSPPSVNHHKPPPPQPPPPYHHHQQQSSPTSVAFHHRYRAPGCPPRRPKLNPRMKSFSLDNPDIDDVLQPPGQITHKTRSFSPQSPTYKRRPLLRTKTNSLDLPDDTERSHSSGSASPCPSPKSQRLLPSYTYVALHEFRAQTPDELDLKPGLTLTVIDTTDPEWWKGRYRGREGFFPSVAVTRLQGGEKVALMKEGVTINDRGEVVKLNRDQVIVIVKEDEEGMVYFRTKTDRGWLPNKYLYRPVN